MIPVDFKDAINQDIKEIDLALSVLNGLRDVNLARLALLHEAEKRGAEDINRASRVGSIFYSNFLEIAISSWNAWLKSWVQL